MNIGMATKMWGWDKIWYTWADRKSNYDCNHTNSVDEMPGRMILVLTGSDRDRL